MQRRSHAPRYGLDFSEFAVVRGCHYVVHLHSCSFVLHNMQGPTCGPCNMRQVAARRTWRPDDLYSSVFLFTPPPPRTINLTAVSSTMPQSLNSELVPSDAVSDVLAMAAGLLEPLGELVMHAVPFLRLIVSTAMGIVRCVKVRSSRLELSMNHATPG